MLISLRLPVFPPILMSVHLNVCPPSQSVGRPGLSEKALLIKPQIPVLTPTEIRGTSARIDRGPGPT